MRRRFGIKEKVNVLTMLYSGMSKKSLANLLGIETREITIWDLRYKQYGIRGLEPHCHHVVSPEQKRLMVEEYLSGHSSTREICVKYDVSLTSLKTYLRQYRKGEFRRSSPD